MKTCPTCGTTYSRRVSFCFDDGTPLVGASEPEAAPPAPKTTAPPVPLPRRGRSLLARRRGGQPVTQEHTDFGDDGYRPKALEPMAVVSRRTDTPSLPDQDRTPPSAGGREHAAPAPHTKPVAATPTPVAQPPVQQQPAIPAQPTIIPPEDPPHVRASEAPTIIREAEEDDEAAGWGLALTVLIGVGGLTLAVLAIVGGLAYLGDEQRAGTRPEPAPIAVVPEPTEVPVPAVVPEPIVAPVPEVPDTELDTEAPVVDPDADTVGAPEPEVPEPAIVVEPLPNTNVVVTPSPGPRPLPDIIVEPIPAPAPVQPVPATPEPASPWTEVAPQPNTPEPVASAPLAVTSTPAGAAVFVNGVNLGATPFRMTMPGGSYPIELRLEGYESASSRVVISDSDGASLNLALVALARSGPVTITTGADWIGAELVVDGRTRGTIPASISSLEEGVHTFVLRKGGNEQTFTRSVSLNAAGMTVLNLGS